MKKMKMVDAKSEAQKIAFSPLTFQAIRTMLNLQIFKIIDETPGVFSDNIKEKLSLSHYTVETLLEVAESAGIVEEKDGLYYGTKIMQCFLYDDMTRINMNFVNDVCYQGAFYLEESFLKEKPEGLKVFGGWPTVYEGLSQLPKKVRQSWFAFDHFYSDNAFNDVIKIISKQNPSMVFDIGCNTGKFELALFSKGYKGKITLIDLPQQLVKAKENLSAAGFADNSIFYPANVLDEKTVFPKDPDIVLMSQFLDCFSKEQIISILKKVYASMNNDTKVYILEPFWDKQKFEAAKLSLTHTSLYFTAIANGNSKMYKSSEMEECVKCSGMKVLEAYENIGSHDYTLLECVKTKGI